MAVETMYMSKVRMYLNAGSNPTTGRMIVKNTLLGYVNPGENGDAVLAIGNALVPCLEYPCVRVERLTTSTIEA